MSIRAQVISLVSLIGLAFPLAVPAADDPAEPSFTNPAQAEHAANMAQASFSDGDQATAAGAADDRTVAYAEEQAAAVIEQRVQEYADGVFQQQAEAYADQFVDQKAAEYATATADAAFADPNSSEYKAAYREAYQQALARAQGDFSPNAWETAVESWKLENGEVLETARQQAMNRAYGDFGPNSPNAYQTEKQRIYEEALHGEVYEKYMAEEVARITGARLGEIHEMRYQERRGWGTIARELGVDPKYLGLGHMKKIGLQEPEIEVEAQAVAAEPLDAEIAEATRRDLKSSWSTGYGGSKNTKGGSSKAGLTAASPAAAAAILTTVGGKGKGNSGQGSSGSLSGGSVVSDGSSGSKSNNGNNGKSDNGNSGKGNNSDSSNNGKSGKSSDDGNSSNNGKGDDGGSRGNSDNGKSSNDGSEGNGNGKGGGRK